MEGQMRIGVFGIGLDTYWGQFAGLFERLAGYQEQICRRLGQMDCRVINAGMIDSPLKVPGAVEVFQQERIELLFLYVSTYALSSTVLPLVQRVKVPLVVLNLQPVAAVDYERFNRLGDRGR